jgi:hypothetical protein
MAKNSINNTVDLEIIQPGATIEKATIQGRMHNNQIQSYQTEKKIRSGSDLTSILQFIGSLDGVRNSSIITAKGSGYYHAAFSGTTSSLFAYPNGTTWYTHIIGNVQKHGDGNEGYFPKQWSELLEHFPEFFVDGAISPWTSILTTAGLAPYGVGNEVSIVCPV